MSFLDTLKSLGLWQGQQPQAAQPNPYGLDPQAVSQARMAALGNIGGQILAMSQQMTPDQRARMMGQADWTGGLQTNLYNAAQMQLMSDAQKRKQIETQRAEEARASIAEMIKKTPAGRVRDAAMYFFQAGDYGKAGELLFKQERRLNPMGYYETVNAFGEPINSGAAMPQDGGAPPVAPMPSVGVNSPAPGPAPIPAPDAGASPMPQADAGADQLTLNWRRLTGDPNLTPAEARQISMAAVAENDPAAGLKVYRELAKNRQDIADKQRQATKDQADIANAIVDDYRTATELPQRIVDFAQNIEDVLSSGDPTGMRGLAVQVLASKVLDPGSAFMTGEADLQQKAASWYQKAESWLSGATEGQPLPKELVLQLREISRQLAQRAIKKLEKIDTGTLSRGKSFGVTNEMMGNPVQMRWNRFADPVVNETGISRREPPERTAVDALNQYGG